MPDTIDPRRGRDAGPDWGLAFARLPLESPPAGSRQRFAAAVQAHARQLDAPRRDRRGTWAIVLASAAVLALVVAAPMLGWNAAPDANDSGVAARAIPAAVPHPEAMSAQPPDEVMDPPPSTNLRLVRRALPGMLRAHVEAPAHVDRTRARQATDRLLASMPLPQITAAADAAFNAQALAQLQQQSRQLESLVAMARDERVGTAAGMAMTSALDAELARLDADLQDPGLDAVQRVALWRQRVDTLQHLAGVATTQRWLAAQGALDQVALVSVD